MSYSIASAWALWPLNREAFSLCSVGSFSQVPTVTRGNHNDKSYQRRSVFVYSNGKDQGKDRVQKCQWGILKGTNL